jgi:hypothetical protein
VIGATATEPQFDNGILNEEVTVSGTLHLFNGDELGADAGYDLDANLFADWDGEPVLVADSVVTVAAE